MSYPESPRPFIQTLIHRRPDAHVRVAPAPYLRLTFATNTSSSRLGIVVSQGVYSHHFRGGGVPVQTANRAVHVPRSYNPDVWLGLAPRTVVADFGVIPHDSRTTPEADWAVVTALATLTQEYGGKPWTLDPQDATTWHASVPHARLGIGTERPGERFSFPADALVAAGLRLAIASRLYQC